MDHALIEQPDWYGALTLAERAKLEGGEPAAGSGIELARKRLERWRTQDPFGRDGHFGRRLEMDGLAEDSLLALLGEPAESLRARAPEPPAWLRTLEGAFRDARGRDALPLPEGVPDEPEFQFLWLADPVIQLVERRLHEAVADLSLPFESSDIERLLIGNLPFQLLGMLTKAAVLELNVARLEERIAGEAPEERFASFVELLRRPGEALRLLRTYPVLARQLVVRAEHWLEAHVELLRRLADDWEELRSIFGLQEAPGLLVEVTSGAGDRHEGGRTVAILTFASGWRVVYKPRPMGIALHFQEVLEDLNRRGFEPAFRTLAVLDRGDYGWMEFVEAGPCQAEEEVRRFYQRQGGSLALLYALDAADFHRENLIAAGEHPVFIDLESIVQPRLAIPARSGSEWIAAEVMSRSVLRIGLLPQRIWGGATGEGIDLSGLGSPAGQLSPDPLPSWEDRGTDAMRLVRRHLEMGTARNRPTLDGQDVDLIRYTEDLVQGFTRVYDLLREHRDELLAVGGSIARLAGDEVRVIVRPTRTYAMLLQESFHPFLLRNALDRDRHFDQLWVGAADQPALEPLLAAERRDLLEGDIPLFTARLGSREIRGTGGFSRPDFFERSGMDLVRERLARLDEEDRAKQVWFIRASLATYWANVDGPDQPAVTAVTAEGEAGLDRLLGAAATVGDRLESLALQADGEATWIGITSQQGRNWSLTPLGSDLYAGLPGVVLFLAYLGEAAGEPRYTRLARAGWRTIWRRWDDLRPRIAGVGGFDGWGGLVYVLTHLGRLWGDPSLLAEARAAADRMRPLIAEEQGVDVVGGLAGCVGSLLALHRTEPSGMVLEVAVTAGERLLALAQPQEKGLGWRPPSAIGPRPLAGFAHGNAGIAWALLELAAEAGDERFRQAALDGIEYERTLFLPEIDNWRDVRDIEKLYHAKKVKDDVYMLAWCHGAPGIGLGRLRALRHADDPSLREEIDAALRSTLAEGFNRNHCLCHGDLGNAELLLQAGEILEDGARWRAEAGRIGSVVLAGIARHGWLSGLPEAVEAPGLMSGLSGIGYGLLRLAQPRKVPALLLMDPPPAG